MKDGLLKRPTIVELGQKASILHEDITKHWIAGELVLLENCIDQANERNCLEDIVKIKNNLLLLETPSEQLWLLNQVSEIIADTQDPSLACEDSKTEEHDVGSLESAIRTTETPGSNLEGNGIACCSNDIIDVAGKFSKLLLVCISLYIRLSVLLFFLKTPPPLEPLTSIFEFDQEAAIVDETTEVRTLLVEETADKPAITLEPGLAPTSSFQDQDSAASVQPVAPPLTMAQIPSLPDNSAESCPLTTASLPTSPPGISNTFLTPLVAPQPSFQASAGSHASSVPSTNLESEGNAQDSFLTIGDARIFFP